MKSLTIATLAALILGQAAYGSTITYTAPLLGASEVPSSATTGTGTATIIVDSVLQTMEVEMTFSGLLGHTSFSGIYCCTVSPGTGNTAIALPTPGFPVGVSSGTYDHTLDLTASSSYTSTFLTDEGGSVASAEAALLAGLAAGDTYVSLHTVSFPGGEIRGNLEPASVPELSTFLLAAAGLAGIALLRQIR